MASLAFVSSVPYRGISLASIDSVVYARLGPTRIQGNAQPACFVICHIKCDWEGLAPNYPRLALPHYLRLRLSSAQIRKWRQTGQVGKGRKSIWRYQSISRRGLRR